MRARWLTLSAIFPLLLASCGTGGSGGGMDTTGTGPFDSNGNYVESWADSPSKWKKGSRGGSDASPDQAEIVALQAPLMGGRSSVTPVEQPTIVRPPSLASNQVKPRPVTRSREEEVRTTTRSSSSSTRSSATAQNSSKPKPKNSSTASNSKSKGATASKTTTKSKAAAVKVKPKPTTNRYAVRQGDSLYAIAKRYGTTAGAIQKANSMSGTMIRPGQSLVIPR